MSDLVVVIFDNEFKAEEVRADLMRMQYEHLTDLEDAVVVVRNKEGKAELHHMASLTLGGAMTGGFLGALMGVILLNPVFAVLGLATGTAIGAVSGSMTHLGISEDFVTQLGEYLKPGTSALCVIVRDRLDDVLVELNKFNGKVLQTTLQHEDESKVREVLNRVRTEVGKEGVSP